MTLPENSSMARMNSCLPACRSSCASLRHAGSTLKKMKLTDRYYAINEGDKVKFLYLAVPNPFQNTVISFPGSSPKEFELKEYADYDKQFAVSFLEPLKNILEKVGWDHERRATLF